MSRPRLVEGQPVPHLDCPGCGATSLDGPDDFGPCFDELLAMHEAGDLEDGEAITCLACRLEAPLRVMIAPGEAADTRVSEAVQAIMAQLEDLDGDLTLSERALYGALANVQTPIEVIS